MKFALLELSRTMQEANRCSESAGLSDQLSIEDTFMANENSSKQCSKCKEVKPYSAFHKDKAGACGLKACCKACACQRSKEWHQANPEKAKRRNKEWHKKNGYRNTRTSPESARASCKKWHEANREKVNAYKRSKYASEPSYRFVMILRRRINALLSGQSKASIDLGCSVEFAMKHIEEQFEDGWNWENRGQSWDLDHIYPLSKVDLSSSIELKAVNNWRNLQPLSTRINRGGKRDAVSPEAQILFDELVKEIRDGRDSTARE